MLSISRNYTRASILAFYVKSRPPSRSALGGRPRPSHVFLSRDRTNGVGTDGNSCTRTRRKIVPALSSLPRVSSRTYGRGPRRYTFIRRYHLSWLLCIIVDRQTEKNRLLTKNHSVVAVYYYLFIFFFCRYSCVYYLFPSFYFAFQSTRTFDSVPTHVLPHPLRYIDTRLARVCRLFR